MLNQFSRTQLLYGEAAMHKLSTCCVAIFGIGGVGGYVVEALSRSGVGALDIIDDDRICLTTTTILGIVVLREAFGLSDIIGAILILSGITLHNMNNR